MTNEIAKTSTYLEVVDPFQESVNSLVVVAFPKSSSKNFAIALSVAQGAGRYATMEIGGSQMYVAVFARTQADAGRASALLSYVSTWKGTMIFSGGKLVPSGYSVSQVIECFLESCSCHDIKAHCQVIVDDPFSDVTRNQSMVSIRFVEQQPLQRTVKIDRYAFPCKYLLGWFRFQKNHPSSIQDQIQAAGVSKGCNICPHFNANDFMIVGTRTEIQDAL